MLRHAIALLTTVPLVLAGCGEPDAAAASPPRIVRGDGTATPAPAPRSAAPTGGGIDGHRLDLTGVAFDDAPLAGSVGGKPFTLKSVEYHRTTHALLLHGVEGQTLFVFLFLDDGQPLAGHAVDVLRPSEAFDLPHLHVHADDAAGERQIDMHMNGYAMRIAFAAATADRLVGRLLLALPDDAESWLSGRFDVPLD